MANECVVLVCLCPCWPVSTASDRPEGPRVLLSCVCIATPAASWTSSFWCSRFFTIWIHTVSCIIEMMPGSPNQRMSSSRQDFSASRSNRNNELPQSYHSIQHSIQYTDTIAHLSSLLQRARLSVKPRSLPQTKNSNPCSPYRFSPSYHNTTPSATLLLTTSSKSKIQSTNTET